MRHHTPLRARFRFPFTAAQLALVCLIPTSCGSGAETPDDTPALAKALVDTLTGACPTAGPGDEDARRACADALAQSPFLRERMAEPFDWGGQSSTAGLEFEKSNRTDFNPRVWRRLYLSTFMNPLELFSFPNQALSARRTLVAALTANLMPPGDSTRPKGLPDDHRRGELIELARQFQVLGDKALAFEGEPAP